MYQEFISFYCWVAFHCMDITTVVYLFPPWKMFRLFGDYEVSCDNHLVRIVWIQADLIVSICFTVLQKYCIILHYHQQWMRILDAQHPCPSDRYRMVFIVILICISLSLMALITFFFKNLFATCISYLVKCLLKSFAYIFGCLFPYCWVLRVLLRI